jgi:hypothetical protein
MANQQPNTSALNDWAATYMVHRKTDEQTNLKKDTMENCKARQIEKDAVSLSDFCI